MHTPNFKPLTRKKKKKTFKDRPSQFKCYLNFFFGGVVFWEEGATPKSQGSFLVELRDLIRCWVLNNHLLQSVRVLVLFIWGYMTKCCALLVFLCSAGQSPKLSLLPITNVELCKGSYVQSTYTYINM